MHTEHVATGMGKLLVLHTAWAMTESKWQAFHATIAAMRATIMIAKRKAKSLRKQVHKQVRVCGGGKYQKNAGRGKTKKKRRREVRKQRVDGNCEKGPETKRDAQKYEKQTATLFCLGLSFGLPLLCFVSDFEGTARHAFSHVAGTCTPLLLRFFTKQIG